MSCLGRFNPKCAGTARSSAVFLPRPSSERTACHAASPPRSPPPPQSPEIGPIAGNRVIRPSGATAGAVRSVAAHHADAPRPVGSGAKHREGVVAEHLRLGPSVGAQPSKQPAIVRREVGAGQTVDAELGDREAVGVDARLARRLLDRHADGDEMALFDLWLQEPGSTVDLVAVHARRSEERPVPAQQGDVGLRTAGVDGEDRRPLAHGRSSSSSIDTNDAPMPRSPADHGSDALAGASRPRVEEDHRPVTVRADAFDRIVRDHRAGSERLPILELDVPVHVAVAERLQHAKTRLVVGSGAERTAEPRSRVRCRWPRGSPLARRGRRFATRRRAAAASARGSASGDRPDVPRRRSAWRSPVATPPSALARRTSLEPPRSPACRGCARRCRVDTRDGPDARRRTSTRRAGVLRHSRVVTFDARTYEPGGRPRSTASFHARSCAGRTDTAGASMRS